MAHLRHTGRLFKTAQNVHRVFPRGLTTKQAGASFGSLRPLLVGAAGIAGAVGTYTIYQRNKDAFSPAVLHAAATPTAQPSVFSETKDHALYLWIHLKPTADNKACAKVVANLQKHVDIVTPPAMRDEDDEILAGVGFGPNFFAQVAGKTKANYNHAHRKGALGDMPSSGGDIFIHAKSNSTSKLFELAALITRSLPKGSVENFEDIYSFVYQNGRDLSGFIDGTENAADEDDRREIAVEKETGGSYVITQVWVHDLDLINSEKDGTMSQWVGRSRNDSTELGRKTISSHVARMTGGNAFNTKKAFEIVRQSMPYGNVHDKAGLFFIGYSASPVNLDFMLDRMVGAGADNVSDDIMRLTKCTKGTYWYFPGVEQLKKLA